MNAATGTNAEPSMLHTYQGQFGEFTITPADRREVMIYRAGLMVAALSFAVGTGLSVWQGAFPAKLTLISLLYGCFSIGFGISLLTIHIYLAVLHRTLQLFWLVGAGTAIALALLFPQPLALTVYSHPLTLLGIGFTFAALTGVFFKEAFCFDRLETKLLTALVPTLLLGHLLGILPLAWERGLISAWAVLFLVFALRKATQPIPPDIGDKSVFAHLKQNNSPT
jgi:uncharacterized integral membrane protein